MAMSAAIIWDIRSTATGAMLNGGGFKGGASGTDYSQQDTAQWNNTDLTCELGSTNVVSLLSTFTSATVGNVMHITAGTNMTIGWYEITAYVDANTVTLDRTPSPSIAGTAGTFYIGGSLNIRSSIDDDFFEQLVAGQTVYIKDGDYLLGESISLSVAKGTAANPITVAGWTATRGDTPTGIARPEISASNKGCHFGDYFIIKNIRFNCTGTTNCTVDVSGQIHNCKALNSSADADRFGFNLGTNGVIENCESQSTNGIAINCGGASVISGCYVHNSSVGITSSGSAAPLVINCIIDTCATGILLAGGCVRSYLLGNTLYGAETPAGTAINLGASSNNTILNNIIYGFVTGVSATTENSTNYLDYNVYYNTTTENTNTTEGAHGSTDTDPAFTDAANADFRVGVAMKALGFPSAFNGAHASCISYVDPGAVQRVEPTGGGGEASHVF